MRVLGVDPGKHGAYCMMIDAVCIGASPLPLAGKSLDISNLAYEWTHLRPDLAVMERVHSMPKQGVVSVGTFMRGFGQLEGILGTLKIRCELVTPQAWKKVILAGTLKDKDAAIAWCRRAYPEVQLVQPGCRVPHDGCADALCIAEYGRRTFGAAK